MNARYSRRGLLAASTAGMATAMAGVVIGPVGCGPSWRLDLDWAERCLSQLRADHAAGIGSAAGLANLASKLDRSAHLGDWSGFDRRRVRALAADACSAAGGSAWGQAEESEATAWSSRGQVHAVAAGDHDTFVRLECTKALSRIFDPYPTPANALIALDISTHPPRWDVDVAVTPRTSTLVEVHRAYAHALLAKRGETSSAYQANAAWDRAVVQADRAGDPALAGWVAHGVWATVVGVSGGKVGDAGPVLPILEHGLASVSTIRAQAGMLVAIACQAVNDSEHAVAGEAAVRLTELADQVGHLPLDRREVRRLQAVARTLLDQDTARVREAGLLVWRYLNGTAV